VVGRKGEAKSIVKHDERFWATIRARAKAAKRGTEREKVFKQIIDQGRLYDSIEWVQRNYCTEFRFWRFCRLPPCRRARACKGDADACLKKSLDAVPRQEIWQTRQKLLNATPRHSGSVERRVRQTWPTEFWPRPVNPEVVRIIEDAERRRQLDEELDKLWNPFGPDGMGPRRR
jgi:hypothetical protein